MVNYTFTEHSRIGECDNALLRETYREESTGWNWKWTEADYWDDPSSSRHGLLRLVKSNARAWEYRDYDALGHKTLEVRQRGNAETPSVFPYVETNTLFDVQGIENAFVTVYDYTPFDGDSRHPDDAAKARQETRYIVVNGVPTNIGHTSTRYTRLMQSGYSLL
jgi:hypothetical protein